MLSLERTVERRCFIRGPATSWLDESLPADYQYRTEQVCTFPGAEPMTVTILGMAGTHEHEYSACGLRIGPGFLHHPLSLDVLFDLVEDKPLADQLQRAIGYVDPEAVYTVELTAGGVHVELAQSSSGRPYIEWSIDGCGHIPSDDKHVFIGPSMAADFDKGR